MMLRQQAFTHALRESVKTGRQYCVLEGRNGFKAVQLDSFKSVSVGSIYTASGNAGVVVAIVR
ncbi:MAG: hypothetical protein K0U21_03000 [Proteobacteria bacterium]|nr:hypothetical protein [Pseudomonadota bacterium]